MERGRCDEYYMLTADRWRRRRRRREKRAIGEQSDSATTEQQRRRRTQREMIAGAQVAARRVATAASFRLHKRTNGYTSASSIGNQITQTHQLRASRLASLNTDRATWLSLSHDWMLYARQNQTLLLLLPPLAFRCPTAMLRWSSGRRHSLACSLSSMHLSVHCLSSKRLCDFWLPVRLSVCLSVCDQLWEREGMFFGRKRSLLLKRAIVCACVY